LPSGTYTNTVLTISDATPGATIYYTLNGTTPTTSSAVYKNPLTLNDSKIYKVEAMAAATGYANSAIATAQYVIQPYEARPKFSPPGGAYTTPQMVTLSATIHVAI